VVSHPWKNSAKKKWIFTINWLSFKRRAPLHNYSCPTMDKTCPRVGNRVVYDFNVTICMLSSPLKSKRHGLKFISITVHHGTCGETFSLVHHRTKGKDWTDRLAARSNDTHPITLQKKKRIRWNEVRSGFIMLTKAQTWLYFALGTFRLLRNQTCCDMTSFLDYRSPCTVKPNGPLWNIQDSGSSRLSSLSIHVVTFEKSSQLASELILSFL
jgi:hypothetical protein